MSITQSLSTIVIILIFFCFITLLLYAFPGKHFHFILHVADLLFLNMNSVVIPKGAFILLLPFQFPYHVSYVIFLNSLTFLSA